MVADGLTTSFVDSRTAYDDLPEETKEKIKDYALNHSQHHSRRKANPGHPLLEEARVCCLPYTNPDRVVPTHSASVWSTQACPDP